MSRAEHFRNRLVCGHRSWLSTTRPAELERCFPCDGHVAVISELVAGLAHPDRVVREPGKYGVKS